MLKRHFAIFFVTVFLLSCAHGFAGHCPEMFIKAMQQEGLDKNRIQEICRRYTALKGDEKPEIKAEQVEKDISGKMVGSWIFQDNEWREIDILSSKYSGEKAKVEINVDTIRNKSGTLRLRYRWTANKWKLVKIFNVDFD